VTPRVAILDFDGTLVDSVGIKDQAFEQLFAGRPELAEIMAFHLANNHMIRFEKIRRVVEDILHEPCDEAHVAELSARFSDLVAERIARAPEVSGACELLDALRAAGVRTYVVSMSPPEEFAGILVKRGLADRFDGVYTYPWVKTDAIADILVREGAAPADAVMIGDAPEDAEAAEACGVPFIGRDSGKEMGPRARVCADLREVATELALHSNGRG
jgi:phosphoglycolate phosphatase-like HAD superfamily hydrolase